MRALLICLLAITFAFAVPMTAQAQQPKISYKDRREAKRLFNQGHLAYRRGDYEEAILKWQESFSLSKEPLINESIANAYERLGDLKAAREHLQKWRDVAPRREHKELDSRIESLDARIQRQDEEDNKKKAEEEKRRREEEARLEALAQQEPDDRQAPSDTTPPDEGPAVIDIVGFSLLGVGGAAVIAGVVLDIVAHTSRPDEQEACTDAPDGLLCRDASRKDIERTNKLALAGDITWIAGAAVAASGLAVVLFLSSYKVLDTSSGDDGVAVESKADAMLVPYASPEGAGVVLQGSF